MTIQSSGDLDGMQRVGRVVARTLLAMREAVQPGVTTGALDQLAERTARRLGARSAPQLAYDFPGFTCISVNEEIVHGIPGPRVLAPGDVVKLDVTLELDGFIADSAVTVLVPPAAPDAVHLRDCARRAFSAAMRVARPGAPVRAIGVAIAGVAARHACDPIRELCGHGVGRKIHEDPEVPNYGDPFARATLRDGLVLAVEPMLTRTRARVITEPDGWTLRTHHRGIAVHHEHTIVVRNGAPLVLTSPAAALAA
jgi:methionyl aminopeptidase